MPEVCLRQRENHSDEAEKVNDRKKMAGTFKKWREHLKKGGKIKKMAGTSKNNSRRKTFVKVTRVIVAEHFFEHKKIDGSR